jgi:DNA mismatch repair protein PMS2
LISNIRSNDTALKHYTSKLASFDDLLRLQTFGFRGEALSSLCALSDFQITTAQANQAPRATRLEFEQSGKLKKTQVVAGQKGTTASVEGLFKKLPVRRRELEKNIKREYGKVLNLLHAYACISTGVRFSVKNTLAKKSAVVFTTNANQTTKENIANVYGAKTLLALIPLDLELEFEPSTAGRRTAADETNRIKVRGHVSKPVVGEGRQTPDRQMFFVNSRPCALPQIAKAFNEVYKSFNVAQSPFVFADFHMDTNAYDVNVSPDKRTILLHDAGALIESLKQSLQELFESVDQTVPQSQVLGKLPIARQRSIPETTRVTTTVDKEGISIGADAEGSPLASKNRMKSLLSNIEARDTRTESPTGRHVPRGQLSSPTQAPSSQLQEGSQSRTAEDDISDDELFVPEDAPPRRNDEAADDDDADEAQSNRQPGHVMEDLERPNAIQSAFDRMRPRRVPAEMATITIGNTTVTSVVGSGVPKKRNTSSDLTSRPTRKRRIHTPSRPGIFGQRMLDFAAPGTQLELTQNNEDYEDGEDYDDEEGSEEEEEEDNDNEIEEEQSEGEDMEDVSPSSPPAENIASQASVERNSHIEDAFQSPNEDMNDEMNDEEKKKHEDAEVQRLIKEAEKAAQANSLSRANKLHKGVGHRDSTVHLLTTIDGSLSKIQSRADKLKDSLAAPEADILEDEPSLSQAAAEERLSLTVTKDDFARMRILGQFNLGFILATRSTESKDELFIIDQHASDEKFNFERLQAETVVQNQRLVHPKRLDLTAVEEEIVIENQTALEKNGFVVDVDDSGDEPIGRRCRLLSLPLSKEVVFDVRDLEELIVLLSETTSANTKTDVPRPSKVRKMFAMRACRSSIMIGKTLTQKQMERVVRNMGAIDKPWNCPHGRPTMRHLFSLGQWDEWDEYKGREDDPEPTDRMDIWREYLADMEEE